MWGTGPTDVYAAGEDGVLFRFNGSTWTALDSRTTQILLGLSGEIDSRVFAVGRNGDGDGCRSLIVATTVVCARQTSASSPSFTFADSSITFCAASPGICS